jgi:hypothetical protein
MSEEEIRKFLEENPTRWPRKSYPKGPKLSFEEVVAKWQGAPM